MCSSLRSSSLSPREAYLPVGRPRYPRLFTGASASYYDATGATQLSMNISTRILVLSHNAGK